MYMCVCLYIQRKIFYNLFEKCRNLVNYFSLAQKEVNSKILLFRETFFVIYLYKNNCICISCRNLFTAYPISLKMGEFFMRPS